MPSPKAKAPQRAPSPGPGVCAAPKGGNEQGETLILAPWKPARLRGFVTRRHPMQRAIKAVAASIILASACGVSAQKGQTVKIAWIDPLSGLMPATGTNQLQSYQFMA